MKPKPTAIPQEDSGDEERGKVVKPTVIPTKAPTTPTPTCISVPPATVHIPKPAVVHVQTTTVRPSGPTAMPGVRRKRLEVTVAELQKLNPSSQAVAEKARHVIHLTMVDELSDTAAVLWGQNLQQSYAALVSESLNLTQAEVLGKVTGHINRVLEILGLINLRKISGLDGGTGKIARLIKRASSSIDSLAELAPAQEELTQIIRLMNEKLAELLSLKEKLETLSKKILALSEEIDAYAIAAMYLAEHLSQNTSQPGSNLGSVTEILTGRGMSLTSTLAEIRASNSLRDINNQQPLHLITLIQSVALVMVPSWLSSIAGLKAMVEAHRKPTVTEIGELSDQQQKIVQQLKGKQV